MACLKLGPWYKIKSKKFYLMGLFSTTYDDLQKKIKKLFSEDYAGDCISFTADCWSDTTRSMMSLTAHFMNNNWKKMM